MAGHLNPNVETLIRKAAAADKSEDAMRFAQAALNATNAVLGLANLTLIEADAKVASARS